MSARRRHAPAPAWDVLVRKDHPDWPLCTVCGKVVNPAALVDVEGVARWTTHPTCGSETHP